MNWFNIERPLYKNGWSWLAVLFPLVMAGGMACYISHVNHLHAVAWTRCALQTFFEFHKVPLAVAAQVFPLMAIVVAIHRSALTLTQINATIAQNIFANYLKHREEFFKFLDSIESKFNITFKKRQELYKSLYPRNGLAHLEIKSHGDDEGYMVMRRFCNQINKRLYEFDKLMKRNYELRKNPKVVTGDVTGANLKSFYEELILDCDTYLKLGVVKSDIEGVYWIRIPNQNIKEWDIVVPVKENNPLFFYKDIISVFDELLAFTYLSEDLTSLDSVSTEAKYEIQKEFNALFPESR